MTEVHLFYEASYRLKHFNRARGDVTSRLIDKQTCTPSLHSLVRVFRGVRELDALLEEIEWSKSVLVPLGRSYERRDGIHIIAKMSPERCLSLRDIG